jgi:multiple sugar transport system substrate-binding protein
MKSKDIDNVSQKNSKENKEKLIFRITWKTYSGRGEAIQKIVNSYNSLNQSDYEIAMIDGDENIDELKNIIGSKPADIYVMPYRFVQYFGESNKLDDLTGDFENEKELFYKELWNLGSVNEKIYGVPWLGHSIGLIYNKDLLKKSGIDPDRIKSLEDLVSACEKVEKSTAAKGIGLVGADHNDVSWMVNQFVYGFGSSLVSADGTKVVVNNTNAEKAIGFYKNVLGKHAQATWVNDTGVEVMNYFRNQKIAFEFQGLWGITDIWQNGKNFETGVIPLENIGLYPEVGPMMLSVQPQLNEKKRKAAVDFIRYMISKQAQEQIMDGEYSPEHDTYYPFRIPVRKDLAESLVFQEYPEFLPFLKGFSKPGIDVPVPKWQIIKDKYYAPGLHKVMTNEISVNDFLKMIELEGNKILRGENN